MKTPLLKMMCVAISACILSASVTTLAQNYPAPQQPVPTSPYPSGLPAPVPPVPPQGLKTDTMTLPKPAKTFQRDTIRGTLPPDTLTPVPKQRQK